MSSICLDLAPILDAVKSLTATEFSFQGESFSFLSETDAEAKLRDLLYERFYIRQANIAPGLPAFNGEGSLLLNLRAANAARPRWQTGWRIDGVHNGGWISAKRDSLGRTFAAGEYVTKEGPGMPLRTGATVDVYFAVESEHMQPGFYFAFGETVADDSDNSDLLRFYWNLEPAGAPLLLSSVSTLLNRFQVPYRFKCLVHPAAYIRADAAVVFVPRRWYQIAARLLAETRRSIAPHLRVLGPLFTKVLADGLAFAEHPGGSQSFGMHRCTALARAIRQLSANGGSHSVALVEEELAKQGISPVSPYLNPRSTDIYDFVA